MNKNVFNLSRYICLLRIEEQIICFKNLFEARFRCYFADNTETLQNKYIIGNYVIKLKKYRPFWKLGYDNVCAYVYSTKSYRSS